MFVLDPPGTPLTKRYYFQLNKSTHPVKVQPTHPAKAQPTKPTVMGNRKKWQPAPTDKAQAQIKLNNPIWKLTDNERTDEASNKDATEPNENVNDKEETKQPGKTWKQTKRKGKESGKTEKSH